MRVVARCRALALFLTVVMLLPAAPVAASAMPKAPNCPIYPDTNVWHSSVQNLPVHPMSTTWLANMGGPSRLLHPDFGGPYMRPVIDGTVWLEDQGVFWIIDVR
ncbi:MAG TPA: hypothetical protein VGR85_07965 [Candidatus Limnocylindria bacterium]|nr:hypothetical protein [Candidatus Limnocylindria bacterium]